MTDSPENHWAKSLAQKAWRASVIAAWVVRELAVTAWGILRGPLIAALNILAALVILFEEWGWKPLHDLLGRLSKFGAVATLERWIAGLPPYGAFLAFALPVVTLLPFKFIALYLLAGGHVLSATGVFVLAKIASTALVARIFTLTKPALMQIPWFAAAYDVFMPWKDALYGKIRASRPWRYGRMMKTRLRLESGKAWTRWRPALEPAIQSAKAGARRMLNDIRMWLKGF